MRNSRDERRDETIAITRLLTIVPRLVSSRLVFFRRPMSQGLCKNYALRLSQIVNMVRKWWEESEDDDENECKCNSLLEFSLTINSSRLPGPRKMREFRKFYKDTFDPINKMAEEKKVSRTAARATGGAPRETRDETIHANSLVSSRETIHANSQFSSPPSRSVGQRWHTIEAGLQPSV